MSDRRMMGGVVEPLDAIERICIGLVPGVIDFTSDALGACRLSSEKRPVPRHNALTLFA